MKSSVQGLVILFGLTAGGIIVGRTLNALINLDFVSPVVFAVCVLPALWLGCRTLNRRPLDRWDLFVIPGASLVYGLASNAWPDQSSVFLLCGLPVLFYFAVREKSWSHRPSNQ